jgi:hypothetical protein
MEGNIPRFFCGDWNDSGTTVDLKTNICASKKKKLLSYALAVFDLLTY